MNMMQHTERVREFGPLLQGHEDLDAGRASAEALILTYTYLTTISEEIIALAEVVGDGTPRQQLMYAQASTNLSVCWRLFRLLQLCPGHQEGWDVVMRDLAPLTVSVAKLLEGIYEEE